MNTFHDLGPVVQKQINANPRLKIYEGVCFSTPKCCSTLIFGKTLHSISKNKNKQSKSSSKVQTMEQKFTTGARVRKFRIIHSGMVINNWKLERCQLE